MQASPQAFSDDKQFVVVLKEELHAPEPELEPDPEPDEEPELLSLLLLPPPPWPPLPFGARAIIPTRLKFSNPVTSSVVSSASVFTETRLYYLGRRTRPTKSAWPFENV
ncbi:hypothetical protein NOR_06192 [Metarhizium rileyi]|uniref:Uncharacterized protein n=1 Tax=Metarhizium rileyi (strain RCEF 4871) TaxID=1649241 RepID=A0A167AUX3_METRR|nr:hypothetical protein NOR_06192 [Metarhizium rileyi RCEF 4871]